MSLKISVCGMFLWFLFFPQIKTKRRLVLRFPSVRASPNKSSSLLLKTSVNSNSLKTSKFMTVKWIHAFFLVTMFSCHKWTSFLCKTHHLPMQSTLTKLQVSSWIKNKIVLKPHMWVFVVVTVFTLFFLLTFWPSLTISHSPISHLWRPPNCSLHLRVCFLFSFSIPHIRKIIRYLSFSDISFSVMLSGSTQVITNSKISYYMANNIPL